MQQGTTQVSSGNIAPAVGPQRDTKEVIVLAGVVLFLSGLPAVARPYISACDTSEGFSCHGQDRSCQRPGSAQEDDGREPD